jgi:hypothetical protein
MTGTIPPWLLEGLKAKPCRDVQAGWQDGAALIAEEQCEALDP